MIINEEKFKEVNYKFCDNIQRIFVDFLKELEDSKCIDEGIANEAIYSLGSNVASCIYNVCDNLELAKHIETEVSECTKETLNLLYSPDKDKHIAILGENVTHND